MQQTDLPVQSARTLIKATLGAAILAAITLTTIILPAEYNIDPTGIGGALGLTELNTEAVATAVPEQVEREGQEFEYRSDSVIIEVPAGKGLEYKLHLAKHGHMEYEWTAENGQLYLDFHGEPTGDTTGYFESFAIATATEMSGSLTTPFDGSHGWYWKNQSDQAVTITLKTKGFYSVIGLKQ
ncbi:hypothetical protein JF535_12030 [Microbulbifer salipaludis]|uniref:Transmembrane anchor protein n=1 Tax=Microbulbifer salipaludis TaxID=187980 RepID=A0ABS3E8J2_9GAMM|nr:hypothetical protein [Microbulbifer salipaludis]MBN8431582.1 hypothetical protein [Microbulbifer salipaludis]